MLFISDHHWYCGYHKILTLGLTILSGFWFAISQDLYQMIRRMILRFSLVSSSVEDSSLL